jgi:hypothetical protein
MKISEAWLILPLALAVGTLTSSLARRGADPLPSIIGAIESSARPGDHFISAPLGFVSPDEGGDFVYVHFPIPATQRMCGGM